MKLLSVIFALALALAASAQTAYTVVAFPDNYRADALSQDIIAGFRSDPTLLQLRQASKVHTYTASNADFRHRWAARIPELPAVLVMAGDQVLYKRSRADARTIAGDIGRQGVLRRLRSCTPDGCPPDNEPVDNEPYAPVDPPPMIPDTVEPPLHTTSIVKLEALVASLTARMEAMESRPAQQGPKGERGEPGPSGVKGERGERGESGPPGEIPMNDIVDEVLTKLPPITFRLLDGAGQPFSERAVYLGQSLNFPAMQVNYQNQAGQILDTEYVPLGGTLNLHIDALQSR